MAGNVVITEGHGFRYHKVKGRKKILTVRPQGQREIKPREK